MIIPKNGKLNSKQFEEIKSITSEFDCDVLEIQGHNQCGYAILGDETHSLMFKRIINNLKVLLLMKLDQTYKSFLVAVFYQEVG